MRLEVTVVARYRVKYPADAVRDIVFDEVPHEDHGQQDPREGLGQEEEAASVGADMTGKELMGVVDGVLEQYGRQPAEQA